MITKRPRIQGTSRKTYAPPRQMVVAIPHSQCSGLSALRTRSPSAVLPDRCAARSKKCIGSHRLHHIADIGNVSCPKSR